MSIHVKASGKLLQEGVVKVHPFLKSLINYLRISKSKKRWNKKSKMIEDFFYRGTFDQLLLAERTTKLTSQRTLRSKIDFRQRPLRSVNILLNFCSISQSTDQPRECFTFFVMEDLSFWKDCPEIFSDSTEVSDRDKR
jgi:hypothetical protein